jgi:hypothetical protein
MKEQKHTKQVSAGGEILLSETVSCLQKEQNPRLTHMATWNQLHL